MENKAICITAGEQSENHVGMNINGRGLASCGFSTEDLLSYKQTLKEKGIESEYYRLDETLVGKDVEPAALLIIRNGVQSLTTHDPSEMFIEQTSFEWDKKFWDNRRAKVLNKQARYNVCYGETHQDADYENKKGTIIAYDDVPILQKWRDSLKIVFGDKAERLEVEGNLYYDTKKCGIGFHGDSERKKVIACSLGESRPIHWQWYERSKPIGERIQFTLNNGDMYIMSEKTTGFDWKKRSIATLRHAAGEKYVR